ncbi:hypothetical protein [Leifsonia sp. RAF41]|uniref:hypothetical protein n=1 Tax=Leifsonia sp. RAF41 TaxID=3233056 RepID=UPI003F95D6AC
MNDEPTFDPRRKAAIRDLVVTNAAANPGRAGGRKRTALIVTLVLLAVSISGGTVAYALSNGLLEPAPVVTATATPTPTPTATLTPTPTATPTPTPTVAAPVQDPSDPSTWVIGFESVGPLELGTPFPAQHQAVPALTDITDSICVNEMARLRSPAGLSFTLVGAADGSGRTAAIEYGKFRNGSEDRATGPKTAEGIGISSTIDELMAAYPAIVKTGSYSDVVTYYGLTDGQGGWIVFCVINGTVADIQIGNEAVQPIGQGGVKTMPSERCPA